MSPTPDRQRLGFVDDLRGVAVLCMIAWHTSDAWLAAVARSGGGYQTVRFFGGMAAPLFLILAGAGVGLAWCAKPDRTASLAIARRGAQIIVLGYALRLQMWLIDALAITQTHTLRAWVPMVTGVVLCWWGLSRNITTRRLGLIAAGVALYIVGLVQMPQIAPQRVVGLLRVDVLQAIGVCVALIALAAPVVRWDRRLWVAGALAVLIAALTPTLQRTMPAGLPEPLAGYVAQWSTPKGVRPVGMFPLFPWLGYALCGVALAVIWARARDKQHLSVTVTALGVVGVFVAVLLSEHHPYVYRTIVDYPDLTQLLRMLYRVGVACVGAALTFAITSRVRSKSLRALGQTSLLIYWVHLEFAFGLLSQPLRKTLTLTQWVVAFSALSLLMTWLAIAVRARRPRGR